MKNNLKTWIKARGTTQSEVARKANISPSYLSLIVSDKRDPDVELSLRLAETLEVELHQLFPTMRQNDRGINRILIVDDDVAFAEGLDLQLRESGYAVKVVENGFEAGFQTLVFRPDLIILDIMMPGINGVEVCRRVKGSPGTQDITILGVSATSDRQLISSMEEAGADDFLAKPFGHSDLSGRIDSLANIRRGMSGTAAASGASEVNSSFS